MHLWKALDEISPNPRSFVWTQNLRKNGLSPAQILRQVPLKTASGRSVLTQFSPVLRVDCRKEVAMRDLNDAYTEY